MIIDQHYSYEDFKKVIESIKNLPKLGNNKFIFLNVTSRLGDSLTVIFEYSKYSEEWSYEAKRNKGA